MLNEVKSTSGGKQNQVLITIVLVFLFTGIGFFGGTKYQQTKPPSFNGQNNFQGMRNNSNQDRPQVNGVQNRNRGGFSPVSGDIISADNQSVTVKLPDGSTKIVLFTDKTAINKAQTATSADLKVGEKVAIFGVTNTDGSVTAQSIQLNPNARELPAVVTPKQP